MVLQFEVENRAYFGASINDRGDDFFEEFAQRHRDLLAEAEAWLCAYFVLVDDDETVVGRFNLYDLLNGTANVGYRVAERISGRGVATSGLLELIQIAREKYRLRTLRASTSDENAASQRVLAKAGFVAIGPVEVGGKRGTCHELTLERL
jgi:ribosomal-protein-alanine N-acetyltransferase